EDGLLPDAPLGGLHELEDAYVPALVPRPDGEPEGGGGLPLAIPGVDHQERAVAALARGETVIRDGERLALGHQMTSSRTWVSVAAANEATSPMTVMAGGSTWAARTAM